MFEVQGVIQLADMLLEFQVGEGVAFYTVTLTDDNGIQRTTSQTCPQDAFLKALAIAVHNDGTPNYETDYPDAELAQPADVAFRFIP